MSFTTEQLLTVKAVAKKLDVSVSLVFRLTAAGEMPQPIHIASATRWIESDIDEWLRRKRDGSAAPLQFAQGA